MDSVARILELIVDFLKRNYKKPKLWFGILGILVFIILIFPYIDSNTFYYTRMEKRISILHNWMKLRLIVIRCIDKNMRAYYKKFNCKEKDQ